MQRWMLVVYTFRNVYCLYYVTKLNVEISSQNITCKHTAIHWENNKRLHLLYVVCLRPLQREGHCCLDVTWLVLRQIVVSALHI